jgi:hypothetical protein
MKIHIEHIQRGKYYSHNYIFRCFYFKQPDILDLEEWCREYTVGTWYRSAVVHGIGILYEPSFFEIFFYNSYDAILFKMIWVC